MQGIQLTDDVNELQHLVFKRIKNLTNQPIVCPNCKSRDVHVKGVKFAPIWKCYHCKKEYRYEPIKNVTNNDLH